VSVEGPYPGATRGVPIVSIIPLDLQRKFEQRWAVRFSRPPAPRTHRPERRPAACRTQNQKKNPPGWNGGLEAITDGVSAGAKLGPRASMTVFLRVIIGQQLATVLQLFGN